MLRIDTAGLSVPELEEIVADRCSSFGTVRKVTVCTARVGSPMRPFALVYMDTIEEARQLAAAFSRSSIGLVVVIPFEPPVRPFVVRADRQSPAGGSASSATK